MMEPTRGEGSFGSWKHYTRLEVATLNKHSSLMGPNVRYEEIGFVIKVHHS
jgi:hypothetical protein